MKDIVARRIAALAIALLLVTLVGCNQLELEKSIAMESVFPGPNQTNVTIYYTVPPAPAGKYYVLWILNPSQHQATSAGQVPGGKNLTATTSVNFAATGAVISIEDQPNPTAMSSTWALKVGIVTLETSTPGAAATPGITPGVTPAVTP
jgi:hypothetical protein